MAEDTFATRMSKQLDKMLRENAVKRQAEKEAAEAKRQAEAKAEQEAQAQQAQQKPYQGGYGGKGDLYRMQEIERQTNG